MDVTRRTAAGLIAVVVLIGLGVVVGRCSAPTAAAEPLTVSEYDNVGSDYLAATANALADLDVWVQSTSTTTTQPAARSTHSAGSATTGSTVASPADEAAFFACVRWRESRGDYTAVNPTGTFRGAYQWYQGGWDHYAAQVAPDWVGVPPDQAPPAVQDSVSHAAYLELGARPWGGACQ